MSETGPGPEIEGAFERQKEATELYRAIRDEVIKDAKPTRSERRLSAQRSGRKNRMRAMELARRNLDAADAELQKLSGWKQSEPPESPESTT